MGYRVYPIRSRPSGWVQGVPRRRWAAPGVVRHNGRGDLVIELRHLGILAAGRGELVAFGRPFISNPDLVRRLRDGIALAQPDQTTFYMPGEKGYTDYAAA